MVDHALIQNVTLDLTRSSEHALRGTTKAANAPLRSRRAEGSLFPGKSELLPENRLLCQ